MTLKTVSFAAALVLSAAAAHAGGASKANTAATTAAPIVVHTQAAPQGARGGVVRSYVRSFNR